FASPGPVEAGSLIAYGGETTSAVSAADGGPRWTVKVGSERGLAAGSGIVAALDSSLVALDARTGRKRWTYAFEPNQFAGLVCGGGLVFAGDESGVLHAVRADDGEAAWTVETGFTGSLAFGDGIVYTCDFLGDTVAVLAATGAVLWTATIGAGEGRFYGHANTLGLIGGTLLVTATDKSLRALDRTNGSPLWTYSADVTPTSAAAATGGLFFAGTRDGRVVALEPPAGGGGATASGR
ncbi:MAG TPA: PQQ-binding-like beta-propeller repeat protein, partial [Phytomonospora sp.]